jgi:3-methyladenine DNA glycosylase AlkD
MGKLANNVAAVFGDVSPITKNARVWRARRRQALDLLKGQTPREVVEIALELWEQGQHNLLWAAGDLLHHFPGAFRTLRVADLERMAQSMNEWWIVDAFAAVAGPMWRDGLLSDARVRRWAKSDNRWLRRAALVSTVYLNSRARGGHGDARRTLAVCDLLKADRDDMVVKGLSWALRALIPVDRRAVVKFLSDHNNVLPARVRREVGNKLTSGLKNPRRKAGKRKIKQGGNKHD